MNKKIVAVIAIAVIALLGSAVALVINNGSSTSNTPVAKGSFKQVDACKVLSPEVASELLGEKVEKEDGGQHEASNDSINVSSCSYATKFVVGQPDSIRSATLLARTAKDNEGAASNKAQFSTLLPEGAEPVSGYGDKAFWDSNFRQLNILKNNNWYIVLFGQSMASKRTLDGTKPMADKLISHF